MKAGQAERLAASPDRSEKSWLAAASPTSHHSLDGDHVVSAGGRAHEVLADKQGRILVPPKLREFAALGREVTFSALTDHFQLWDKVVLEQVLKSTEQRFQDPEFFQKLGL